MAGVGSVPVAADSSSGSSVPKWVYALAIGVPVSAALLYILFGPGDDDTKKRKVKSKKEPSAVEKKTATSTATPKASEKTDVPQGVIVEDVPEDAPTDPLEKAVAAKNRGNKYFRGGRYELAIKCYTEAIELCPSENTMDLSTFHQNRAAAYDQMENMDMVISDCDTALNLNNKYVKALDRRAKTLRKQAMKIENFEVQVEKLKQCVEDITSVCLLEGFQKQEHLVMVDQVLRELGRAEAALASKTREPVLTSAHFITQYFSSFAEDPILKSIEKEAEGDMDEKENNHKLSGFLRAKKNFSEEKYGSIVEDCTQEIESNGEHTQLARLLRGTFYILMKQPVAAMEDLTMLIDDSATSVKVRVNALVKRASLYIQQCKDPKKDPDLSFADFARAAEVDPENADVYHHRGQVHLLIDDINKAIVDFNKAVAINPSFPVAYAQKLFTDYRAASMIGDTAKVKTVLSEFESAVTKFPKCVESYALCAQVLNDQQEFSKADQLYLKAIEIDPTNANLLVHRGLLALQSSGNVEGAVKLMQEALSLDEKCEFAYETLGTVEVQRGNLKRAIELFDKAIPLANTELEMAHLFGLRDAAMAQITVSAKFGIVLPAMGV